MCPIDPFWESWSLHFDDIAFIGGFNLASRVWVAFQFRLFSERMGVSRRAKPISARKACGIWAVNWILWCRTPSISAFTMSTHGIIVLRSCGILVSVVRWARTVWPCVRGLSKIAGAHLARSRIKSRTDMRGAWHDRSTSLRTRSWSGWSAAHGMTFLKVF